MKTIKVKGQGHIIANPDEVHLSFEVNVKDKDYSKCLALLNERVDKIRQCIISAGLSKSQLKTGHYNVRSDSELRGDYSQYFVASHYLNIILPLDKNLLNDVLLRISACESNAAISIGFSVKDKESLRKELLKSAVKAGIENAELLASAAGVKLGNLINIEYGWTEVRFHDRSYSMCLENSLNCQAPDIEPSDLHADDSVTLIFEIHE